MENENTKNNDLIPNQFENNKSIDTNSLVKENNNVNTNINSSIDESVNNKNNKNNTDDKENITKLEKLIQLNKLGALCLAGNNNSKALTILKKTIDFYEKSIEDKEISNFFYGNLYCNYAKALSVDKNFDESEKYYKKVINNHPVKDTINALFLKEEFDIDLSNLYTIEPIGNNDIEVYHKKLIKNLDKDVFTSKFYNNSLNSLNTYSDALVNLAVIFQIKYKESLTSFKMFILSIFTDKNNSVANIDYNSFLRENNFKHLSDEYITNRIVNRYKKEIISDKLLIDSYTSNKWRNKGNLFLIRFLYFCLYEMGY